MIKIFLILLSLLIINCDITIDPMRGNRTIRLPCDQKLITFFYDHWTGITYLTHPLRQNENVETYKFHYNDGHNMVEIIESRCALQNVCERCQP